MQIIAAPLSKKIPRANSVSSHSHCELSSWVSPAYKRFKSETRIVREVFSVLIWEAKQRKRERERERERELSLALVRYSCSRSRSTLQLSRAGRAPASTRWINKCGRVFAACTRHFLANSTPDYTTFATRVDRSSVRPVNAIAAPVTDAQV